VPADADNNFNLKFASGILTICPLAIVAKSNAVKIKYKFFIKCKNL
jgi:hypothetical protein